MAVAGVEPAKEGLRVRSSPTCTLSQNGYGTSLVKFDGCASFVYFVAANHTFVIDIDVMGVIDVVGSSSQANCLLRNSAMDDSIGGS